MKKNTKIFLQSFLLIIIATALVVILMFVGLISGLFSRVVPIRYDKTALITDSVSIKVLDKHGNSVECDTIMNNNIELKDLPEYVPQAFVSIEDKRFYTHNGINVRRMFGALISNIKSGKIKQGASTITQQLVKNLYLSNEKTIGRKLKEILLAQKVERELTKDKIMEKYLNTIYFGSGTYGIEQASHRYFDKSSTELSIDEAATLAGIIKAPTLYSPILEPESCIKRRNLVLKEMLKDKYLTQEQYDYYVNTPLNVNIEARHSGTNNYVEETINEARSILNLSRNQLLSGGYTIVTYLDTDKQNKLSNILNDQNNFTQDYSAAMISIDSHTGGINAYDELSNTNIFSARRQPGSTIKPIVVYAPAIEYNVLTPQTPILDESYSSNGYSPKNWNNVYHGYVTVKAALSKSLNVPAVKVLELTGIDRSKYFASKNGIKFNSNDKGLSIALGGLTDGVTIKEISSSYVPLSNGGNYHKVAFIKEILNNNNNVIYRNTEQSTKTMKDSTAYLVTDILKETIKSGTAKKLSSLNLDLASKTGTVGNKDGNTDIWNITYSPSEVVCTLVSSIDSTNKIPSEYGGSSYPTDMAKKYFKNTKNDIFNIPASVKKIDIDRYDLENNNRLTLASQSTAPRYITSEYFAIDNLPSTYSTVFDTIDDFKICVNSLGEKVEIIFNAKPYLNYELWRKCEDESILICKVENKTDKVTIVDTSPICNNYAEYYVIAYQANNSGIRKTSNIVKFILKSVDNTQ